MALIQPARPLAKPSLSQAPGISSSQHHRNGLRVAGQPHGADQAQSAVNGVKPPIHGVAQQDHLRLAVHAGPYRICLREILHEAGKFPAGRLREIVRRGIRVSSLIQQVLRFIAQAKRGADVPDGGG